MRLGLVGLMGVLAFGATDVRSGPPPPAQLWLVQPPGEVVAVDLASLSPGERVKIPPAAFARPEQLAIDRRGHMLFPRQDGSAWVWNGAAASVLPAPEALSFEGSTEVRVSRRWFLSAGDEDLFAADNLQRVEKAEDRGPELVVTAGFLIERRTSAGVPVDRVLEQAFEPCSCGTGACEETCPEGMAWAPRGVVGDFFFVTHWVPGQLQSRFDSTLVVRRRARGWLATPIDHPVERMLDAAADGSVWIEVEEDAGCCGWSNESDDRATVVGDGSTRLLFDEWSRYRNSDWDVSFYTSRACFAPDRRHVAIEINGTEPPGAQLRPSSEGHPDSLSLEAMQRSLAELPVVEVQALGPDSIVVMRILHAELVGWSSSFEIIIVEDGRLLGMDVTTGRRRESGLHVRSAADAFLPSP